jgi:hypothetical protein
VNRRSFLSLFAAIPLAGIKLEPKPKDLFFDEIKLKGAPVIANMNWDRKNIFYINQCFLLNVNNPRALGVITNIGSE